MYAAICVFVCVVVVGGSYHSAFCSRSNRVVEFSHIASLKAMHLNVQRVAMCNSSPLQHGARLSAKDAKPQSS